MPDQYETLPWSGAAGEVVVLIDDLVVSREGVVVPYWHLRFPQDAERGGRKPVWFAQAIPIGVWPAFLAWLPAEDILPLAFDMPVLSFQEQERRFLEAFRKRQVEERRLPLGLRCPLPCEAPLVERLAREPIPYTGLPPAAHAAAIKPRLMDIEQERLDAIEAFEDWRSGWTE